MKQFFTFLLLALSMSAKTQTTYCYQDKDKDGYGDPSTAVGSGPFGCPSEVLTGVAWVNNGDDCDDGNPNVNPGVRWYRDADGDGYHDNTYITSCVNPGPPYYLITDLKGVDCDDADGAINPGTAWGYDSDGDGYFADNNFKNQCQSPGLHWYILPLLVPIDCDDNNPAINVKEYWYLDADHDGYPGSLQPVGPFCAGVAPANYRPASQLITTSAIDCDDQNSAVTSTRVYKDLDGDGYTNGTFLNWCFGTGINPPFKYTTTPVKDGSGSIIIDCNDNDPIENNPFQAWYTDGDGDKHGTLFPVQIQCNRPAGYFARSELESLDDCDDSDPSVWQTGTLYIDNDGDGYDNGQQTICYGNVPAGYALTSKGRDCNDNDPLVWQSGTLYIDNDGDGYDNGQQTICYGDVPPGYALTSFGSDCDDSDPRVHSVFTFYWDDDHDGYGDPNNKITSCAITPPKGYVTNGNDCDDDNSEINPITIWYKDQDNDGYSDGTNQRQCTRPAGYKLSSELASLNGDCDDNDITVYPGAPELCDGKDNNCNGSIDEGIGSTWYLDNDHDGYGDPAHSTVACTQPANYVSNNTDCDDNDNTIYPGAPELCDGKDNNCNGSIDEGVGLTWYRDNDHDGYGDPAHSTVACSQPANYVSNNTDCDDNDNTVFPNAPELCDGKDNNCNGSIDEGVGSTWYRDNDHDGFGDPAHSTIACLQPANYVSNNTDCNDNDVKVHSPQTYYLDADKDGYGNPAKTISVCSSTPPKGYVKDNTDCNDNSILIHAPVKYYVDNDHDGYGSQTTAMLCTLLPPSGYSINNLDCNDNNAAVHPFAQEICGNGIDDNCNGQVDEGCTVCKNATVFSTTNITSSSAKLNWTASVNPVQWQVEYKNTAPGSKWIDPPLLNGAPRSLPISGLKANQTYQWHIRAMCGKSWTAYSVTISFKTGSSNIATVNYAQPLAEEDNSSVLQLYPNPNNGQFIIRLHTASETGGEAKIQLIDVLGRVVQLENADLSNGRLQKTIIMSPALTRGIYLVRIVLKDKTYQAKLIYQR